MKKTIVMIFTLLLAFMMAMPVCADTAVDQNVRLYDEADILTVEEEAELSASLDEISQRQEFDVAVATVPYFDEETVEMAAEAFIDDHDLGYGDTNDVVLLYISMEARDLNLYVDGYGLTAFTVFGREQLVEEMITQYLGDDAFYEGFTFFATWADTYISEAKAGTPFDEDHPAFVLTFGEKLLAAGVFFLGFLVVGAIIALVIVLIARAQLTSVGKATDAANYVKEGSLNLRRSKDKYIRTDISKVPKPKDDDNDMQISSSSNSTSAKF